MISAVRRARPSGLATMRPAAALGNVAISRPIAWACAIPRSVRGEFEAPLISSLPVPFRLAVTDQEDAAAHDRRSR